MRPPNTTWRAAALIFAALLLPTLASAQTDPCTATSGTATVLNPTKLVANLPEQTTMEVDGVTPRVTDYQLAYFATGAAPATATPVAGPVVVAKSAWTLVTGTTDCYTAPLPIAAPTTAAAVGALKARRAATASVPAGESNWSVISNPFGSAPTALAAPGLKVAR